MQLVERHAIRLSRDGDGDDLLGQDVERVARHHGRLDQAFVHPPRDDRALQQVAAELREDAPGADPVDAVAGAADALQPARDRLRRLDLQHQVHRAHVDAQLQRARRHQARQLARLQQLLHLRALLARQRAVVGARDVRVGQLVQAQRHALGRAAVVDEHDRRRVGLDELQQLRVDRRPDGGAGRLAPGERVEGVVGGVRGLRRIGGRREVARGGRFGHRVHGNLDAQVELLGCACVDDGDLALGAYQEAPDLLQRVLGGAQADALDRPARLARSACAACPARPGHQGLQALERQGQVRAALGVRHRVDLIHDHRLHPGQHLARLRGQDQVQRLRRRDQDVRRVADHRRALARGGVARADAHAHVLRADAAQRGAEVALDVVRQGLQGAYVDHARGGGGSRIGDGRGVAGSSGGVAGAGGGVRDTRTLCAQAVERPQERRQRLARAGGGGQEHVLAACDRRPGLRLRGRGGGEGPLEPLAHGRAEGGEGHWG